MEEELFKIVFQQSLTRPWDPTQQKEMVLVSQPLKRMPPT
jgi:hypothetical protein